MTYDSVDHFCMHLTYSASEIFQAFSRPQRCHWYVVCFTRFHSTPDQFNIRYFLAPIHFNFTIAFHPFWRVWLAKVTMCHYWPFHPWIIILPLLKLTSFFKSLKNWIQCSQSLIWVLLLYNVITRHLFNLKPFFAESQPSVQSLHTTLSVVTTN